MTTPVWVDRQGREEPVGASARAYVYGAVSPDGTRVLLNDDDEAALWIWDVELETSRQVTTEGVNRGTVWSPDGQGFAFSRAVGNTVRIYRQSADGSQMPEPVTEPAPVLAFPTDITADGDLLFTLVLGPGDIWRIPLHGETRDAVPLITGPADDANATVSSERPLDCLRFGRVRPTRELRSTVPA